MALKNQDLHGNAPDKAELALLLIDVINDFEFPEGDQLLEHFRPVAQRILELKRRAEQARIPTIYVNDNFGRWQSNFNAQIEHCLQDNVRGKPIVELLKPGEDDYFVLKAKHSGFFNTTLELLLRYLQVRGLILCGVAGNNCVLFTASDAYMRDFQLFIPQDCIASNTLEANEYALKQMESILKADTRPSPKLQFELRKNAAQPPA